MKTRTTFAMALTVLLGTSLSVHADHIDDQIASSAKKSYAFRHYLRNDHVKVHSNMGRVTLTGSVSSESHRQIAYETVAAMSDVKHVNDELKVLEKSPDANSDAWVGIRVKNVLRYHGNVSVVTHVDVKNGVVTLRGKAYSEAQKALAADFARDVEGVKDVDNKMTVMAPSEVKAQKDEPIDDATVTAEVKITLKAHHSTSAVISHVRTDNGVVTLAGDASSVAVKNRVTHLVEDINGVKRVINNMTY